MNIVMKSWLEPEQWRHFSSLYCHTQLSVQTPTFSAMLTETLLACPFLTTTNILYFLCYQSHYQLFKEVSKCFVCDPLIEKAQWWISQVMYWYSDFLFSCESIDLWLTILLILVMNQLIMISNASCCHLIIVVFTLLWANPEHLLCVSCLLLLNFICC